MEWLLNLLNQSDSHGQLDRALNNDIRQLRRHLNRGKETDSRQDQQIRQLQLETAELKRFVSALLRLLVSKGVAQKQDLAAVADLVRREMKKAEAEQEGDGQKDGRSALAAAADRSEKEKEVPFATERVRKMRQAALEKLGRGRRTRRGESKRAKKPVAKALLPAESKPAEQMPAEKEPKYPSQHRYKF